MGLARHRAGAVQRAARHRHRRQGAASTSPTAATSASRCSTATATPRRSSPASASPAAICITPGAHQYIYVSNSNDAESLDNGEIYKMELDGKIVGKFGRAGRVPKEFNMVNSIDCRSENELFVGELGSWRVQKLTLQPGEVGRADATRPAKFEFAVTFLTSASACPCALPVPGSAAVIPSTKTGLFLSARRAACRHGIGRATESCPRLRRPKRRSSTMPSFSMKGGSVRSIRIVRPVVRGRADRSATRSMRSTAGCRWTRPCREPIDAISRLHGLEPSDYPRPSTVWYGKQYLRHRRSPGPRRMPERRRRHRRICLSRCS